MVTCLTMTLPEHMRFCLTAPLATSVWLGAELVVHGNDAFAAFLGAKQHAAVLGRPAREGFGELWAVLEPLVARAPTVAEDVRLVFDRDVAAEEVFATIAVSRCAEGVWCTFVETTRTVVARRRADALREGSREEVRPRSGKRVLIVEDSDETARALKNALELLGHEVALAHDGPVALTVARTFRPDVALVDLQLPVMDGYELATRLRATSELRLVAVAASADTQRAQDAGFAEHLVKPVDLARLECVVASLA